MTATGPGADRARALLEIVERDRVARVEKIEADALTEADRLVRAARADAHALVRQAIAENRARTARRLEEAQADLSTRSRRREHETHREALTLAWKSLRALLEQRWRSAAGRRAWITEVARLAADTLPNGDVVVDHPSDIQRATIEPLLVGAGPTMASRQLTWRPGHVEGGLRLSCDGVTIDGTIDGLLAAATEVRGRLMSELTRDASDASPQTVVISYRGDP